MEANEFHSAAASACENKEPGTLYFLKVRILLWSGLIWPEGRRMEVPETTMDDARPWYPTGSLSLHETTLKLAQLRSERENGE